MNERIPESERPTRASIMPVIVVLVVWVLIIAVIVGVTVRGW